MKVLIVRASNLSDEEVLEVKDWNELIQKLFKRYKTWIIETLWDWRKKDHPEIEFMCIKYDDYME